MANNNITFKIGSTFSGEGFKKARTEVAEMNTNMKKGVAAATQMSSAIGGLDTSASKAMTAMTGMLQSLLTFNATAILTQAAMIGISTWTNKMKEAAEALTNRMNELKASVDKAFNSSLTDRMSAINTEIKNISSSFETTAKQAIAFTNALEGVRAANAQGGIAQLAVDKLNEMLEAHTEAERENIEKAYNLKIAQAKLIEAEEAGAEKVNAAIEVYELNKKRVANIEEQLAKVEEERKNLEEQMISAKLSNNEKWKEIEAKVNALKQQEADLYQKRLDTENAGTTLELKVQQAKEEAKNAILNATAAVKQVQLANQKEAEAAEAKAAAEKKAAENTELLAAAQKKELKEKERAAKLQKEVNDSSAALKKAQDDYANAVKEYDANFMKNTIAEAFANSLGKVKSGTIPVDVQRSVQTTVADKVVDDAIRNNLVNSVKDADRLARQAARHARDEMNKGSGQRAREAAKYERLMKVQPKNWSKQDVEFVAKFNKIKEVQEESKKNVDKAKKAVEEAKTHQKNSAKNLEKIVVKLNNLGLK